MSGIKKYQAYMVTDCGEPTSGSLKAHEPLLIFLNEEVAQARQQIIVGDLYEVEIRRLRKSRLLEERQEEEERKEYERLKAKFEATPNPEGDR